jgi:hypothetical protein
MMFIFLESLQVLNSNACNHFLFFFCGWGRMPHYRVNAQSNGSISVVFTFFTSSYKIR